MKINFNYLLYFKKNINDLKKIIFILNKNLIKLLTN